MKEIPVVFQNDEIIIINKFAGLPVQGGQGISHSLDTELPKQLGLAKVYLVHRLDKETSGLMVVAKNPQAASKWIKLIGSGQVKKEYAAICFGLPVIKGKRQKSGMITSPVQKGSREQAAETHFTVERFSKVPLPKENADETAESIESIEFSLIRLTLGTGRMHQIRIHLASTGCPIAGDDKHGDFKLNKKARKLRVRKLMLASVKITLPIDGKKETFEIPLPDHMDRTAELF